MNVTETFKPLQGEVALAIAPAMALRVDADPALKRARFSVGRTLTPQVLQNEQEARSQRSNGLLQAMATGVIRGFNAPFVQANTGSARIDVSAGLGIAQGEDVVLPAAVRLNAPLISVAYESLESAGPLWTDLERRSLREMPSVPLGMLASKFAGRGLASAAVLIARPIRLLRNLSPDVGGPCHDDADPASQRLAFEDAIRFEWVLWPHRDNPLPARDSAWRNRLAWRIFDAEATGKTWPWQGLGLPIALAGFEDMAAGRLLFLDSHAVVREGGGMRARTSLLNAGIGAGLNEPLAQAQVLQLSEHLAELSVDDLTAAQLPQQFDRLPPAGLLPASVVNFQKARQSIFPPTWSVSAQVISDDMVEALVAESARLAPLSLSRAEQVELLVPVPGAQFSPDLLRMDEPVDPLFAITISAFESRRAQALRERASWAHRHDVLAHAISGVWPERPSNDPLGLSDELFDGLSYNAGQFFPRVHAGGKANQATLEAHGFDGAQDTLIYSPNDKLMAYVEVDAGAPPQYLMLQPLLRDTQIPPTASASDIAVMKPGPVFWWGASGAQPPAVAGVASAALVRAGNLPTALNALRGQGKKRWLRLEVDVSFFAPRQAQSTVEGLVFGTICGVGGNSVAWGHAGALRADRERHWIADTLPQGANIRVAAGTLAAADGDSSAPWPWQDRRESDEPVVQLDGFLLDDAKTTHELSDVSALITQGRGNPALQELQQVETPATDDAPNQRALHQGLAAIIETLDQKSRASNDLVDLGFLRSRVDLYRLRSRLLGADEADRMLTSPGIADLVKRSETSYINDQQLSAFINKASSSQVPQAQETSNTSASATRSTSASRAAETSAATSTRAASTTTDTSNKAKLAISASNKRSTLVYMEAKSSTPSIKGLDKFVIPAKAVAAPSGEVVAAASHFNLSQNNITLGERLSTPVAVDAWSAAATGKTASVQNTVMQLTELRLPIGALPVYGYQSSTAAGATKAVNTVADLNLAGDKLINLDHLDADIKYEADYFTKGIDSVDNSIRFLRGVESLVESYRRLRDLAQAALARLQKLQQRTVTEIARLDSELAELRHDLGVARSLLAEERQRIDALIRYRKGVLAQVPYVVFRRPRQANVFDDLPVRSVETGLYVSPVPACRGSTHAIPMELQRMVDAMRDLPARYFNRFSELLLSIDNRSELIGLIRGATDRARLRINSKLQPRDTASANLVGVAAAVQSLQLGFMNFTLQHASSVVQQAPQSSAMNQLAWSELSTQAFSHLVVSDLFHSSRTLGASGELDDMARVAACLHRNLGQVPPAVRLNWALQVSSFDVAPSLRQLSVLPQFGDHSLGLDFSDWHGMQDMVTWLFSRIDARSNEAEHLMNDLVRIIILLASHAPVRELIPARLALPVRPVIGALVQLNLDALATVNIGMEVSLGQGVATAVVHDVSQGKVLATVTQADASAQTLNTDALVQLSAKKGGSVMSRFTASAFISR